MTSDNMMTGAQWRKSSYSGGGGNGSGGCVELAWLCDARIGIRDSKSPHTGVLTISQADLSTLATR